MGNVEIRCVQRCGKLNKFSMPFVHHRCVIHQLNMGVRYVDVGSLAVHRLYAVGR